MAISPEALDAMAILATVDWLNDKPPAPPRADSDHVAMDRQDFQGQSALRRGLCHGRTFLRHQPPYDGRDSVLPQGSGDRAGASERASELGINLMRLGKEDEAKAMLEEAWNAGFQDLPTQNTLNLMTSYKNFDYLQDAHHDAQNARRRKPRWCKPVSAGGAGQDHRHLREEVQVSL